MSENPAIDQFTVKEARTAEYVNVELISSFYEVMYHFYSSNTTSSNTVSASFALWREEA